jgi:hypothetical protein
LDERIAEVDADVEERVRKQDREKLPNGLLNQRDAGNRR